MSSTPEAPAPVRSRRVAREAAFQGLYQVHVAGVPAPEAADYAVNRDPFTPEAGQLARTLVTGVAAATDELDAQIAPCLSTEWSLSRLAVTDLLLLRMAAFEFAQLPEVPPLVTITEYVSLAKRFGSADSGRFVHGVLGTLLPLSAKARWTPPEPSSEELAEPDLIEEPPIEDPEPEEVVVEEGTPEYEEAMRAGRWVIRAEP